MRIHITPRIPATVVRKSDATRSTNNSASIKSNLAPAPSSAVGASDAAADFRALFTSHSNPPTPAAAQAAPPSTEAPTAQSLFGPNPWMANPGGIAPNGATYGYNPYYFATAETAAKVAQMVGGTVVQANAITPYGPFQQNQPNYMVQLPDGRQIYAGLFASFYDHGYTQEFVDRLVKAEVTNPQG
jgi:hypothetical protein